MGRYFEDFETGEAFVTRGRTLTEADIMQYAGLCWDTQAEHTNAEFARRGPFGERIGQQQLGLLIAHGLLDSLRLLDGTLVSVLRLGWNFFNPMKIGDTLHVKQTVLDKKDLYRAEGGLVAFEWETVNQRSEVVHRCRRTVLVARRAAAGDKAARVPYLFMGLSDLESNAETRTDRSRNSTPAPRKPEQRNRGKYFEEFEVGEELTTQARTVAEADTINYTILSWDTDPLHTDAVYAQSLGFNGTLAPLLLPIVFANGLGATLGFLAGTNRGALGDWWEFVRPVRIGDTLHFRQEVASKQDAQDPETGIVTFNMEMIDERGEVVSRGQRSALVARLPKNSDTAEPWNFVFGTPEELARK
jgi:3-hydroxybutyryl-CoA dehydratase